MFERYTERARRVIFFARYEASQYGSAYIESEHLLLGLLREDRALAKWFPGEKNVAAEIRADIERRITRGERISTSVEVPLTAECKKILNLAGETAEKLGHRWVETEHLLIGILRVEASMAAQILFARGLKPDPVQDELAKVQGSKYQATVKVSPSVILDSFLAGLKCLNSGELISFFAKNAEFIDAFGKRWNREEMFRGFETLFDDCCPCSRSGGLENPDGASDRGTDHLEGNSLEFAAGGGLLKADAPGGDFGLEIILALHRGAREAAKHGDLADVRERVGDGGLQKSFRGRMQRLGGSEVVIEFFHGRKKAIDFGAPRQRCGVVPGLLALGHGKRPIKQIAHVREDLCRRARLVADVKTRKMFRRAA